MQGIPAGARLLSDHLSEEGRVGCRTKIWRTAAGGFGALIVQDSVEVSVAGLVVRLDDIESLAELDRLLLAELNRRAPARRLLVVHSAAGACERASWAA